MLYIQLLGNPLKNLEILLKSMKIKLIITNLPFYFREGLYFFIKIKNYFFSLVSILGGSRKKIAKNIIPKVPTNKNV